jgi:carbon-monoxide dehydrogenase medium subunit
MLKDGVVHDSVIVVSAATEKVTRLPSAERVLHSGRLDDQLLRHAGDAAAKEAILLSDAHGSAAYKRELLRVHLGRAVRQAADGTGARQL